MRLEKNMDAYFKDMADMNTGHLSVGSSSFSVLTFWRDFLKRFKISIRAYRWKSMRGISGNSGQDSWMISIDPLLETAISGRG